MKITRLAILASGSGTNAEAIMKWVNSQERVEVVCVLSDKKNAYVLKRAEQFKLPAIYLKKNKSESNIEYDKKILDVLKDYRPNWITLAGYMKILGPTFLKSFPMRVINIHPSLLPLHPGLNAYENAYKAGDIEAGCTIHFVDEGIDTGEIIAQRSFKRITGESFEDFHARGLKIENSFYPEIIQELLKRDAT